MSVVKLPYYPQMIANESKTLFGVTEIDCPAIYDTPINNRIILRIDTLECLKDEFDSSMFVNRDFLYALLSGQTSPYNYNELLQSFYRCQPKFMEHVNQVYFYGDNDIPIVNRILLPLRKRIDDYTLSIKELFDATHNKFLVQTHDYLYYSVYDKDSVPDVKGMIFIC